MCVCRTIKQKSVQNRWWLMECCQHDAFTIIILCSSNRPQADTCALLEENLSSLLTYRFAGVTWLLHFNSFLQTETFGRVNGINSFIANLMASNTKLAYYEA